MVGFRDNVASKKPLGKRHRRDSWDSKPELLEDRTTDQDGDDRKEARISPMRKIIRAAKEIHSGENDEDKSPGKGDESSKPDAVKEKEATPAEQTAVSDAKESTKSAEKHAEGDKKPVKSTKEGPAVHSEKERSLGENLKVREYLHNFKNSLTEMKQKLIMSRNDIDIVNKETGDYKKFIENEEDRSRKLYELHAFLSRQYEDSGIGVRTENVLKNEIEANKAEIKELKDELEALEMEDRELESALEKLKEEHAGKLNELKKAELRFKSQKELREIERGEFINLIEEKHRIEDAIFTLKMEHKKEHQRNTTLKARSEQLAQTLSDLKNIMGIT